MRAVSKILDAYNAGRSVLIRSPKRVLAHTWGAYELENGLNPSTYLLSSRPRSIATITTIARICRRG